MLLMMVALSVCMVSCGDDDDPVEQIEEETGIIGTWIHTDNGGSMTYRFNKNGTGSRTLVLVENGNSMTKQKILNILKVRMMVLVRLGQI